MLPAILLASTFPQAAPTPSISGTNEQSLPPIVLPTLPLHDAPPTGTASSATEPSSRALSSEHPPAAQPVDVPAPPVKSGKPPHAKGDPLENFNRRMFKVYQGFDRSLFRPVAMGYKHVVPKPVRSGIRNFFSNLTEPIVFLNYLLQLKPGKAAETAGRFLVNSTVGIGGLADVAKTKGVNLPHRPNGFGNTLGYYGVKPGPYIFLPIVGPTTLRDFLAGQGDALVLPIVIGKPFDRVEYQAPRAILLGIDKRAESDSDLKVLLDGAVDPYATLRSVYLQNRTAEIQALKGKSAAIPDDTLEDPLTDPAAHQSKAPELSDPLADPAATPPETAPHP